MAITSIINTVIDALQSHQAKTFLRHRQRSELLHENKLSHLNACPTNLSAMA
jgi:hypothetical protein